MDNKGGRARKATACDILFGFAFNRHCARLHNADYEVCRDPLCWLVGTIERYLWYGGKWNA